ncbi:hypothetical protein F4780DRAFT_744096 [Xylariomycetidae sp. FL0641]|nr:hypothetical protein F4780DRAFT_744096 [Xylariomycetidae sp. FL0641]
MSTMANDSDKALVPLCHIVTPVGMLGYGFQEDDISSALASLVATQVPVALILDSGSTDSGPDKLALGTMSTPRTSYARDLRGLIRLVHKFKVPLIFSSAGGDGSDEHVREVTQIIDELTAEEGNEEYSLKTVALFSGIEKQLVSKRLKEGRVTSCGDCVPDLKEEDIEAASRVVAQMGPEPFTDAMEAHPDFDVLVGGRAYDPSPYIGYAMHKSKADLSTWKSEDVRGYLGGLNHMGKIMECGGICAEPKSHGAIATVYQDGTFDIKPTDPKSRCTPLSIAAHTLYEKTRPDILHGPGGYLDLNTATYERLSDGRTVRVRGSTFHSSQERGIPYQVKLEAATVTGYRTMFLGSFRDPILIKQLDTLLKRIKEYVTQQHRDSPGTWELDFHTYGKSQQANETLPMGQTPEVSIVGEVLASSQDLANSVASTTRVGCMHGSYPGQKATSGNFAFGIGGKTQIPLGPCPQFCIYHLMDLEKGEERLASGERTGRLFSHTVTILGKGQRASRPVDTTPRPSQPETGIKDMVSADAKTTESEAKQTEARVTTPRTLGDLARYIRSKNAGPYEITFDVMFESKDVYHIIKQSGLLTASRMAEVFGLSESDIVWCGFFDPAQAFKVTIPRIRAGRRVSAGGFMENDVHGSQQHLPLMYLALPEELLESLAEISRDRGRGKEIRG